MTQPLGYYTNYTPGDSGVLDDIQETYGAQLQKLNRTEKLALIVIIASDLCCLGSTDLPYRSEVFNWMAPIKELPIHDREGLIQCLISGVRFQK